MEKGPDMRRSVRCSTVWHWVAALAALACVFSVHAQDAPDAQDQPARQNAPAQSQPILPVAEVEVGMRGYGLSVFHGDTIEPFPFEVVSIVPDSDPKRAVIWVNCYDERMQKLGPVQGMSGSPMYVWDEGEEQKLGVGGKLIGAFAFGYALTNECMVGVQPIEYMRETAGRANVPENNGDGDASSGLSVRPGSAVAMLRGLRESAEAQNVAGWQDSMVRLSTELVSRTPWGRDIKRQRTRDTRKSRDTSTPFDLHDASPQRLMLPIDVGSPAAAQAVAPMMHAAGLFPYAGGSVSGGGLSALNAGSMSGAVPSNVNADRVELAPGSVLAVPLAFGDYVPAAAGTVTDVLPDGTVLGFGHAMDGMGDTALPMATGYTHFVVSRINNSFKRTGVLALRGSLVQDEQAAVAGKDVQAYTTSPQTVTINLPEQPSRTYHYEIVNHPAYTPSISLLMPIVSLSTVQAPPDKTTMHLTGELRFSNGKSLSMDTLLPLGTESSVAFELAPLMATLLDNEFATLELAGSEFTIDVQPGVKLVYLQNIAVSPAAARPGDTVSVSVDFQPYEGAPYTRSFEIDLPSDLPPGEYPLIVGDAESHMFRQFNTVPRWSTLDNLDELFDAYDTMLNLDRAALYISLMRQDAAMAGVSVGNLAMPKLPSHHAALLRNHADTTTLPGVPGVDFVFPLDDVTVGEIGVAVTVVEP